MGVEEATRRPNPWGTARFSVFLYRVVNSKSKIKWEFVPQTQGCMAKGPTTYSHSPDFRGTHQMRCCRAQISWWSIPSKSVLQWDWSFSMCRPMNHAERLKLYSLQDREPMKVPQRKRSIGPLWHHWLRLLGTAPPRGSSQLYLVLCVLEYIWLSQVHVLKITIRVLRCLISNHCS